MWSKWTDGNHFSWWFHTNMKKFHQYPRHLGKQRTVFKGTVWSALTSTLAHSVCLFLQNQRHVLHSDLVVLSDRFEFLLWAHVHHTVSHKYTITCDFTINCIDRTELYKSLSTQSAQHSLWVPTYYSASTVSLQASD